MARSCRIPLAAALVALAASGCAPAFYHATPTGKFEGRLTVEWIEPNTFIYRPAAEAPLTYTTADGRSIRPRTMYTDGGSIPRLFWSMAGMGPWDFAPAYVIHDWLFEQHHCKEGDWESVDFPRSASVLSEAMKTQMVKMNSAEPTILYAVNAAVRTDIARKLWEKGECRMPASRPPGAPAVPGKPPVILKTIDMN